MSPGDVAAERPPSVARRLLLVVLAVGIVGALGAAFVVGFLLNRPATMSAVANPGAPGASIHLAIAGSVGSAIGGRPGDPHPSWPGYLPTTTLNVPANSVITVQIDQEDSARGLRNPFWSQSQGIVGGTFHMTYFDSSGKPQAGDFSQLATADDTAHTFAIPDLGVFVPLQAVNAAAPPGSMNVITFSFRTGRPGVYHWQCFVPCGSGTAGNGGPMQTLGYMVGLLVVQ